MSKSVEDLLASIDRRLAALLAVTLDSYLRDTGVAQVRHPSVDTMLRSVGLSAKEIAALLGKTERAVQLVWQREEKFRAAKRAQHREDGDTV